MSSSKRPTSSPRRHSHPLLPSGYSIVVGKQNLEIEADPEELKAYPRAWRERENVPLCPACGSTEVSVLYYGPLEVRDEQQLDRLLGLRIHNRRETAGGGPDYECPSCRRWFFRADRPGHVPGEMVHILHFLEPGDPGYEKFQNFVQIGGSTRTGSIVDGRYRTLKDIAAMLGMDVDKRSAEAGKTSVPTSDADGADGSSAAR